MASGIYKILNLANQKCYIGSSVNIENRWRRHISNLRTGNHKNKVLQNSWDKHGDSCFAFSILEEVPKNKCLLEEREQYYLDFFHSADLEKGYNLRSIAANNLGIKLSDEAKSAISLKGKGRKQSADHIAKRIAAHYGHHRRKGEERPAAEYDHKRIMVAQHSFDGQLISTFKDAKGAAEFMDCARNTIAGACRKGSKTKGFYWSQIPNEGAYERVLRN